MMQYPSLLIAIMLFEDGEEGGSADYDLTSSKQSIIKMGNSYIGPYVVESKLGKGHFGKSRLCQTIDHYPIAAKIIEVLPGTEKQKVMKDVSAFYSRLNAARDAKGRHPLLRFREVTNMEERCFGVVSQYCSEGNLDKQMPLRKEMGHILQEMKQLAQCVEWLHRKGVVHGDIKPTNILYKDSQLLISDMMMPAFSHVLRLRDTPGTYDYFSPEHFSSLLSPASDIWSLGVIFLEMFHRKKVRELQQLQGVLKPSMSEGYPSPVVLAAVTHPDLQALIAAMLRPVPNERVEIEEVVSQLEIIANPQLKTMRKVALRKQEIDEQGNALGNLAVPLAFSIDHTTPFFRHFQVVDNKIQRLDAERIRVQAISREKIPLGVWSIAVAVLDYGQGNEQLAIGFTTQERRKERMSGDIDQAGSLAYWSNKANKKGNFCINGEWSDDALPFLKEGKGVLQMVVNTEERSIHWYVNSEWIRETAMPRNWWDQSLFFFAALMGRNCTVELLQPGTYK